MNTTWKNRLQEYCQKNKISFPNYRIKNQSGPAHILKFQVEVEVNDHWYTGDGLHSSKKEAEQSAAKKAWEALLDTDIHLISTQIAPQISIVSTSETSPEAPPSYTEAIKIDSKNHLPDKYADIEQFIANKVEASGGRIRKISQPDSHGRYKFDISGSYRYCENVKRHHKKNQIYFIVDPVKKTYFQKCFDSECYGFQSSLKRIADEQTTSPNSEENNSMNECPNCRKNLKYPPSHECERCGEKFCKACVCLCELCHDAVHCKNCFESCFDCHDS